jgi:hypothetical protein
MSDVSLGTAKALKAAGWDQDIGDLLQGTNARGNTEWFAAPDVDELLEALEPCVFVTKEERVAGEQYVAGFLVDCYGMWRRGHVQVGDTPAEALAAVWIWWKENGHTESEKSGGEK